MQAVILAAGKGSRLHPITLSRTKAMLPILGKPMVERVIESIAINGVKDFIVVVSPGDRNITRHFQHESRLDIEIRFVYQTERKGMAHALSLAAPLINEDFILSACDNLVSKDDISTMLNMWREKPSPQVVLSLMHVSEEQIEKSGMVELDGNHVLSILEKPRPEEVISDIASLPLYIFSPGIFDYLPKVQLSPRGEYELQDAIQMLISNGSIVLGQLISGRLTVTTAADLLSVNRQFLLSGGESPQLAPQAVGANTTLITPLHIELGTIIGADCVIGPNVYIEKNCCIGQRVKIANAVVLRETTIADDVVIDNTVVSKIQSSTKIYNKE